MKTLKLDHALAEEIAKGQKTSTWRINDDKDLHVNDQVSLVDKVVAEDPTTWKIIGTAKLTNIHEKQLGDITTADMEGYQQFSSIDEALKLFRGYYGPQVNETTPVKIIRFTFTSDDASLPAAPTQSKVITEMKMFADGGSRGNPGPSASGYVLLDMNNKIIVENGLYLGVTTNNQAEYHALKIGLQDALQRGVTHIEVYLDSLLVVNQMKGIFKVKNRDLAPVHASIQEIAKSFASISYSHVPRELNKLADAMVNQVLDAQASVNP